MSRLYIYHLANFIGEFIIFSTAGLILFWDSTRTSAIERKRRLDRDERIQELSNAVDDLKTICTNLEANLRELQQGKANKSQRLAS